MKNKGFLAVIYAILAAVFYAINVPFSKLLLENVSPTFMASLLYFGAGIGVGIMYAFHIKKEPQAERLSKRDLPYTVGMVVLDIAAPIFLMVGLKLGSASNASLLGNFEIVATTLFASVFFREKVSPKLWCAIALITVSGAILSLEGADGFAFSIGSVFVLLATVCWGLENNCTRHISGKSTYQIVTVKGICSGLGSLIIAFILREPFPAALYILAVLLLGFVAYGLSIFTYIRAQKTLGAAKTSAFYAIAPFVGAVISFFVLGEKLTPQFAIAFAVMVIGTALVVFDLLTEKQS